MKHIKEIVEDVNSQEKVALTSGMEFFGREYGTVISWRTNVDLQ